METTDIVLILIFGLFIIGIIVLFFQIISAIVNYFFRHHINRYLLIRKLKPKFKKELEAHSTFYNKLEGQEKKMFERRVQKFINMKEFVPRGELKKITPKMKALIAASAIQITFGYPGIYFVHFWKILVYQNNYYSKITEKYHQGEVNTKGLIFLSWESFLIGINNPKSGRNLGLHEMAHALRIENAIRNHEYDFIDFDYLIQFEHLAKEEMELVNSGDSMFRAYAGSNTHEMFAIAVENFFERPRKFEEHNPELFRIIAKLLNQRPHI